MTNTEISSFFVNDISLNLLVVTLVIFTILVLKSGGIRSFQFQMSIFIIIWIAGEILHVFGEGGFVSYPHLQELSPILHFISMISISLVFLLRYIYVRRDGKKILSDFENT